ncbi:MAG TPA: nitroreductase family protein, partial [Spirochaetia bacterium]|nr:nitroreductase family protein [Spirochaetia bacterium]
FCFRKAHPGVQRTEVVGLSELLEKTRDHASFESRDVDPALLDSLWAAVRATPSAANTQPWEVYLVRDSELKSKLDHCVLDPMLRTERGGAAVSRAPVAIIVAYDRKRARARFGQTGESLFAIQDTAAAVANLRLAAAEKGLATCWIREVDLERLSASLSLIQSVKPVALLTLGYSQEIKEEPPLLPVEEWLHCCTRGD